MNKSTARFYLACHILGYTEDEVELLAKMLTCRGDFRTSGRRRQRAIQNLFPKLTDMLKTVGSSTDHIFPHPGHRCVYQFRAVLEEIKRAINAYNNPSSIGYRPCVEWQEAIWEQVELVISEKGYEVATPMDFSQANAHTTSVRAN